MSLADRISQQLAFIEQNLADISGDAPDKSRDNSVCVDLHKVETLRDEVVRLQNLCDILNQFGKASISIQEAVNCIVDAVQQVEPIDFSAIILRDGDEEEGPYHYCALNGIQNSFAFMRKTCEFSYSGVLARAMYQRLSPEDSDYVHIRDLTACILNLREEFPWVPQKGSLLIIPLRTPLSIEGVLVLGKHAADGFAGATLRDSLYDIAVSGAGFVHNARIAAESNKHEEQLVNAQLLTREISNSHHFSEMINTLLQKIPEITAEADISIILQNSLFDYSKDSTGGISCEIFEQPFQVFDSRRSMLPMVKRMESLAPLIHWTIRRGQPVFFEPEELEDCPEHPFYSSAGGSIIVPIQGKEISYGVIHISAKRRRFDESDMVVLRTIANSAAITLRGIYMYEKYLKVSQDNSVLAEENMLLGLKKLRTSVYSPSIYTGDSDAVVPWLMARE